MAGLKDVTRDSWIMSTFPEWGTWLNEEIDNAVVEPGQVEMWWLGCVGIWFKTPGGANVAVDFWAGNGKRTHGDGLWQTWLAFVRCSQICVTSLLLLIHLLSRTLTLLW